MVVEGLQLFFAVVFLAFLLWLTGRLLLKPLRLLAKLLYSGLLGLFLLWLFNLAGSFLDLKLPINLLTVLVAGLLGLPGLILLIILRLLMGG